MRTECNDSSSGARLFLDGFLFFFLFVRFFFSFFPFSFFFVWLFSFGALGTSHLPLRVLYASTRLLYQERRGVCVMLVVLSTVNRPEWMGDDERVGVNSLFALPSTSSWPRFYSSDREWDVH